MSRVIQTVNPATGQPGKSYPAHSVEEAVAIVQAAHAAFGSWKRTSVEQRAALLRKVAGVLRARKDEFAALMTAEMGKTLTDGRAEIEKCAGNFDYYAEHGAQFLAETPVDMGGSRAKIAYRPLGVVLAVMPWNFPFWQVLRFAAPTLMAGNAAVLKHASNVPGCALAIEQVFQEAGFPADVFRTVLIGGSDVATLIDDPAVAAVTLTGSTEAGRQVASRAGHNLKKCVLELGGSDAYLILEDADVALAAEVAATARMVNGGQSCVAGKRFIVVSSLKAGFEAALTQRMEAFAMGDPTLEATKLGPLESIKARDDVHGQVRRSVEAGARLLTGGVVPAKPGAWYPPTVLTDVHAHVPVYEEEVFGPVAAIIEARDEADAIRIANSSVFGLGSGVITGDAVRGERIATEELDAGMSFVNTNVRSDPRLPFGGVKQSGYGRECSELGLREFVNAKTVLVA